MKNNDILKIFIRSIIVLLISVNTIYGNENIYSTSPNIENHNIKARAISRSIDQNIITFSEYSNGTYITDQYADRGIIFGGDTPFISSDGSNPTSPVLTGSPRFNGAIEGYFVDPVTHEPRTVNHFELDGGYFNKLSSTRLQWFNTDGDLIAQKLDEEIGIEHFTVDAEGIASWRIEVISDEPSGYAIDNVSFEVKATLPAESLFEYTYAVDKITHTAGSDIANTFTIYFKNLKEIDGGTLDGICDYDFFVEDINQKLEGTGCNVNQITNSFKVNFTITLSPYNLEDANVTVWESSGTEFQVSDDIKDFFVYGTAFDVTKDGFSFGNSKWNKYMFIHDEKEVSYPCFLFDLGTCTKTQITNQGQMYNLVNALKEFVPNKNKATIAQDIIGYYESIEDRKNLKDKVGGAMCHGLAISAMSNFNNRKENSSWGTTINTSKSEIELEAIFKNHWVERAIENARPFNEKTYTYDIDYFETAFYSLSKIAYYYLSQSSYAGKGATDWVGHHNQDYLNNINNMNNHHQDYLKNNRVSNFTFTIKHDEKDKDDGGHGIIATALIKYSANHKNHSTYIMHDNNYPNMFSILEFTDKFELSNFIFNREAFKNLIANLYREAGYNDYVDQAEAFISNKTSDYSKNSTDFLRYDPYGSDGYSKFRTFSNESDELFVYGKNPNEINRSLTVNNRSIARAVNEVYDYAYPNHISITVVGAKLLKVTDTQTQKEVILNPIIGTLEQDKGYSKDNLLITEFLLPKNSIYKIELQKYIQYPAFEVYAKIPTGDGKVEIINYENLATNLDDATLANFLVGNNNTEKSIVREGESNVTATYDELLDIQITPVYSLKAIALSSGVKLSWTLPNNSNLEEVIVIRKETTQPESISDGSEVYRGLNETYTDSSAGSDRKYYYAIYAIAKSGEISEGTFVYVDTHKATLFGYVKDNSSLPVIGAEVIMKNGVGLDQSVLHTETTDKNGFFSFSNLPLGTYILEFSHSNYTFAENSMTVELEDKNMEVAKEAVGIPYLAMSANAVMQVDGNESITWDGLNISDTSTINIKLYRNNTWETLALNIEFSKHQFNWKVTEPQDENATLKIELSSNPDIGREKNIYIFAKETIKYDFDGNGKIDILDIMKVASKWNSKQNDGKYELVFDLNNDGKIDIVDIMLIASKWGL